MRHFEPRIQTTFWCKWRITKTSECAKMLSKSVTAWLREHFCGYLSIEFAPRYDFFDLQIGEFFLEIGTKKRIFLIGNGALYRTLVIGRKGPGVVFS